MYKFCLAAFAIITCSAPASAAIIIQIQNATIAAGGTGFVDVLISSTGTDSLASAGFDFRIMGPIGNGSLRFRSTAQQSNSEQSASAPPEAHDYVFLGDTDPGNFFAVRQLDETRLLGGDSTFSGTNVMLDGTQKLLARLEIEHVTGTPLAAVGDTFTIGLWNDEGDAFDPYDDSTLFLDDALNPLTFDLNSTPSTLAMPGSFLNFGTITVTAAAVPEPGSFVILGILAAVVCTRRMHRTAGGRNQTSVHEVDR
jgi:hypothetical protein